MSVNVDAMVREGINAYKSGHKEEARALLLKATELDQYNEQAWLWLSGLMDSVDDQRTCLENVLAINPENERAKQGLSYLTGQTSAGNVSPFSAATPPPSSLPPTAPTSVEWSSGQEPLARVDSSPAVAPPWAAPQQEPTPDVLDDWVSNLNLPSGDTKTDPNASLTQAVNASSSPFGDFDPEEDDVFSDGPFSAAPFGLADEAEVTDAPSRSAAPPAERAQRASPLEQPRREGGRRSRRTSPGAESTSMLYDVEREQDNVAREQSESELFGYLPPEIKPTRLPGTRERLPSLLVLGIAVLIVLNVAAAALFLYGVLT